MWTVLSSEYYIPFILCNCAIMSFYPDESSKKRLQGRST